MWANERVCVCDFINGLSQSYFIGILNYAMNLLPHIICLAYFRSRIAGNGATYVCKLENLLVKFKAQNTSYSEFILS